MASELGVQTIQHPNGTDALTIDSSGIVTAPKYIKQTDPVAMKVIMSAGKTEAQLATVDGVSYVMPFNTVCYDPHSTWNSTTYQFTAPVTGLYMINFHVRCDGLAGYLHPGIRFKHGGTGSWTGGSESHQFRSIYTPDGTDTYVSSQLNAPVRLDANTLVMAVGTDGGMTAGSFHANQSFFAMTLLG